MSQRIVLALGLITSGFISAQAQQWAYPARTSTAQANFSPPFYWIHGSPSADQMAPSSGTISVAGAPSPCYSFYKVLPMNAGNGYGINCADDAAVGDGKNIIYHVEAAFPSSNCSSDLIVSLTSSNCTIGGVVHGTAAACTALRNGFIDNKWSSVCYLTNNVGALHPNIQFAYVSGSNLRLYATAVRFTQLDAPCAKTGPCTVIGPVSTNNPYVTVAGVTNINDMYVAIYERTNGVENPNPIGLLSPPDIIEGTNQVPVAWDADSLGATIVAVQCSPTGQEGCHIYNSGYIVGGGANPSIRISLNCKTSEANLNVGPVGTASDSSGNTSLFFMPGPTNALQYPQSTGILVQPSTNWQTIIIDPRIVQKGWKWSGHTSGSALAASDHVDQWAGLESLIFQQDPANDTGPMDILIDNMYSGTNLLVDFDTAYSGATYTNGEYVVFYNPTNGYTGYPVGYSSGTPNSALVVSNNFALGGTNVEEVQWQWKSTGQNWFRFLLYNGADWNYPQIRMDAPFQFDILLLPKGATQAHGVGTFPPLGDQVACSGGTLTVEANITPPVDPTTGIPLPRTYTYQWSKNGTVIPDATDRIFIKPGLTTNDIATYSVVVTDQTGNSLTRSMMLTAVNPAIQIDSQPMDAGQQADGSGYASFFFYASAPAACPCDGSAPIAYQWLLNGEPLADNGANISGATTTSLSIYPTYYTNAGTYSCLATNTCTGEYVLSTNASLCVMPNVAVAAPCSPGGLLDLDWTNKPASYPPNPAFTGAPAATNAIYGMPSAPIDFNWDTGSFSPGFYPDATNNFTLRFVGSFQAPYDPGAGQLYTFYTRSDDGVRLWVDGQLIIDSWNNQSPTTHSGSIMLTTNKPVDFILEYFENSGGALLQLSYSSLSQPTTVIPASQLCPAVPGQLGGGGIPPLVTLTTPVAAWLSFPVTLSAAVTAEDAIIDNVQFYDNDTNLLATIPAPGPYTASWTPPALGPYSITARVNYNSGTSKLNTPARALTVYPVPTITLTAPVDGATFTPPADIPLAATVETNSAAIDSVKFYQGTTEIGTGLSATWSGVDAGSYEVYAVLTYNTSTTLNSLTNTVVVSQPVTCVDSIGITNVAGAMDLGYTGGSGSQFVLLMSADVTAPISAWTPVATNTATPSYFHITPGTDPAAFYRVKSE